MAATGSPASTTGRAAPTGPLDAIQFDDEKQLIGSECEGCLECFLPCMRPKRLNPLHQAVILVRNAYHGRPPAIPTPWSMAARRVYHNRWYRLLTAVFALVLCSLGFVEPSRTGSELPSALVPITEVICLLFFAADCGLQYVYLGRGILTTKKWTVVKAFLIPVSLLSMAAVYATDEWSWAFVRLVRPVFLLERFRNVRRIAASIISATPKILSVAAMLGMANVLFGVLGFVLFAGIGDDGNCTPFKGGAPPANPCSVFLPPFAGGCRNYFSTLMESMTQLFVLTTTANFPDVMLPAFKCNKWSALFFIAYILLSTLFLLNLVLAATYTEFKALTQRKVLARYSNIFDGVDLAFARLIAIMEQRAVASAQLPPPAIPLGTPLGSGGADMPASPITGAIHPKSPSGISLLGSSPSPSASASASASASTPGVRSTTSTGQDTQSSPAVRASSHAVNLAPYKPRPREYRGIDKALWTEFFQALHPKTPSEACTRMFDSLDGDKRGQVYQLEFRRMILFYGRLRVRDAVSSSSRGRRAAAVRARLAKTMSDASRSVRSMAASVRRSGRSETDHRHFPDQKYPTGSATPPPPATDSSIAPQPLPSESPRRVTFGSAEPRKTTLAAAGVSSPAAPAAPAGASSPAAPAGASSPRPADRVVANPLATSLSSATDATGAGGDKGSASGSRRQSSSGAARASWVVVEAVRTWMSGILSYALASDDEGAGVASVDDDDDEEEEEDVGAVGHLHVVESEALPGDGGSIAAAGHPDGAIRGGITSADSVEDWPSTATSPAAAAAAASEEEGYVLRRRISGPRVSGRVRRSRAAPEHNCCGSARCCEPDRINSVPGRAAAKENSSTGDRGGGEADGAHQAMARPPSWCGSMGGTCRRWRGLARPVLRKRIVNWAFDLAVMINAIVVLYELVFTASSETGVQQLTTSQDAVDAVQYSTLAIFLVEVCVKIWAFGLCKYASSSFNKLDIVLALAAIVGTSLELSLDRARLEAQWSSAITFVRTLRILRPLRAIAGFGTTVKAFLDILPVLAQYLTVLISVFYAFGIVGVGAFAGVLSPSNHRVAISSYGVAEFYPYNFDDLASAMTSLFYLMVVNNWPIIMEGCVAATNSTWARSYFVAFYLVTVVLVLNVLVAFIIESFGLQKARIDQRQEAKMRRRRLALGLSNMLDGDDPQIYGGGDGNSKVHHGRGSDNADDDSVGDKQQHTAAGENSLRHRSSAATAASSSSSPSAPVGSRLHDVRHQQKVKRKSVGEASRWRQRLLEADTNVFGDAPPLAGEWELEQEDERLTWDVILGFEASSSASLSHTARKRLERLPKLQGDELSSAVERLMSNNGGWRAVPAGSEWRLMLGRAGSRLDEFRVTVAQSPFDIYDSLYRDAIHGKFPKTFSAARRMPSE